MGQRPEVTIICTKLRIAVPVAWLCSAYVLAFENSAPEFFVVSSPTLSTPITLHRELVGTCDEEALEWSMVKEQNFASGNAQFNDDDGFSAF